MGKARALRLGIKKGVQHTVSVVARTVGGAVLPSGWKCPICHYQFDAVEVKKESVASGRSPESILAEHIETCIRSRFPNMKSKCYFCGKKFTIDELKEHVEKEHPDDPSDTDNSERNSVNTESQSSAPVTEERDVKSSPITSYEGSAMLTTVFSTSRSPTSATGDKSERLECNEGKVPTESAGSSKNDDPVPNHDHEDCDGDQ